MEVRMGMRKVIQDLNARKAMKRMPVMQVHNRERKKRTSHTQGRN